MLDAENNPDLKAEVCNRPCLAVLDYIFLDLLNFGIPEDVLDSWLDGECLPSCGMARS